MAFLLVFAVRSNKVVVVVKTLSLGVSQKNNVRFKAARIRAILQPQSW
jgi:hypothetical protein